MISRQRPAHGLKRRPCEGEGGQERKREREECSAVTIRSFKMESFPGKIAPLRSLPRPVSTSITLSVYHFFLSYQLQLFKLFFALVKKHRNVQGSSYFEGWVRGLNVCGAIQPRAEENRCCAPLCRGNDDICLTRDTRSRLFFPPGRLFSGQLTTAPLAPRIYPNLWSAVNGTSIRSEPRGTAYLLCGVCHRGAVQRLTQR